ncbi:MAG: glycosyltransferase [Verrucomicrobia bacterium]|jgi:glycosyltransferase involved in cell wall biosynthesis|nr:glycosyltransferase [Verrucomicrobiota bacterium]
MSASPQVSLLIPTHNNARTVAETIASCIGQTFRDLEILIYDEASTDGTREILHKLAATDPRLRVMTSDENSGPLRAWRKLLYEARGEYCTWVWSDDLLLPRYVEVLRGALVQNPTHWLAGCNAYRYYYSADPNLPVPPATLDPPDPSWGLLNERYATATIKGDAYALGIFAKVYPVTQMCNLFRTAAVKQVFDNYIQLENPFGFDYARMAYGNDVAFLSEMGLRSGELVQVGDPLVVARSTPNSLTERLIKKDRWQYWLQYTWAFYYGWSKCRALSPRMNTLINLALDRVHFCNIPYGVKNGRWPRYRNPFRAARALGFILRHDRHFKKDAGPDTMEAYLARH